MSYGPDSQGYSGTLYKTSAPLISDTGAPSGTAAEGATYTRTKTYQGNYSGTVYKPDTRIWQQNYSGTAYGSTVYYYSYTVTLNYNLLDVIVASNSVQSSEYWGIGEYDEGGSVIIPCAAVCHVNVNESYTRSSSNFTTISSTIFAYAEDWGGDIGGYDLIVQAGSQVSLASDGTNIGSQSLSPFYNYWSDPDWICNCMSSTSYAYYSQASITATGSGTFYAPDAVIWLPLYWQPSSRSVTTSTTF